MHEIADELEHDARRPCRAGSRRTDAGSASTQGLDRVRKFAVQFSDMASSARTRRIEIRVTDEEHSLEEAAAEATGVTLIEFYRRAARASAEEVLAERSRITLDDDEAARFLDALDHPERFEVGLHRLAERPPILPS